MSKKDFKDINPVMQFLSPGTGAEQPQEVREVYTHNAQDKQPTQYTHPTHNKPMKVETKSKRLNLLIQPSLFEDISKIATMKQTSVNDLINTLLSDCKENNIELVKSYNKVFKK